MANRPVQFNDEITRLSGQIERLQVALRSAFDGILSVDAGARACGRALGLTRSLAWSIWNLAFAPDIPAALRALPGEKGWKLLVVGLSRRGCAPARLEALQVAVTALTTELKSRDLQPTLLRSIASGALDTEVESRRMRAARKRAREAAEVMYGIRTDAMWSTMVAGPPDAEGVVDTAGINYFAGLARLRPGPEWPIFQGQLHEGNAAARARPLVKSAIGWALDTHCTPGSVGTALHASDAEGHLVAFFDTGTSVEAQARGRLAKRSGDRTAKSSEPMEKGIRAAFGQLVMQAGRVRAEEGSQTRIAPHLGTVVTVPTRLVVFDMLVHRDVPMHAEPVGALYGPPDPWPTVTGAHGMPRRLEAKRLPLDAAVEIVKTTEVPAGIFSSHAQWGDLLSLAIHALGRPLEEFRMHRLTVIDPPMHGRVLLRWTA